MTSPAYCFGCLGGGESGA